MAVFSSQDNFDEDAAGMLLETIRWGDELERWCPACTSDEITRLATRPVYRCRACNKQFTVTSGTVFDRHKLPASKLLKAILWYEETQGKGRTADLSRLLACQWKTAHVLKMRLWEAFREELGIFAGKPFFARWYWQGFNMWNLDRNTGKLTRRTKHGLVRNA